MPGLTLVSTIMLPSYFFETTEADMCAQLLGCIDKTSSAELSEAINSMFNWYRGATECYAYLNDVSVHFDYDPQDMVHVRGSFDRQNILWEAYDVRGIPLRGHTSDTDAFRATMSSFVASRWFTRGWTLQELIAPENVIFFGLDWNEIGRSDRRLLPTLVKRTGIPHLVLTHKCSLDAYSVAQRMSWAALRQTSRKEDEAYCLLGIFGVNMPLLYGEGAKAFQRLQEEIVRSCTDHSIFAWSPGTKYEGTEGALFAPSPRYFEECSEVIERVGWYHNKPFHLTNLGLSISLPLIKGFYNQYIGILQCQRQHLGLGLALIQKRHPDTLKFNTEDVCSLHPTRLVRVDLEDLSKAEDTSIVIQTHLTTTASSQVQRQVKDTLWFRLRNYHISQHYKLQELWPPEKWKASKEIRFEYKVGSLLVARFNRNRGKSLRDREYGMGGIILAAKNSSHRFAICFNAGGPDVRRTSKPSFRLIDIGSQDPRDRHLPTDADYLHQLYYKHLDAEKCTNAVKDLEDAAELRVIMKEESTFAPCDIALEVTIDSPANSSHG